MLSPSSPQCEARLRQEKLELEGEGEGEGENWLGRREESESDGFSRTSSGHCEVTEEGRGEAI